MSQDPSRRISRNDVRVRAWRAILEVPRQLTSIMDAELQEDIGMDLSTYDALLHVFEAGAEGIRMTDLSREMVLSKSGLTNMVDRLEAAGLLRRIPDPSDRRSIRVDLTEEGEAAFRSAGRSHLEAIERHFATHITDDEAAVILDATERVRREN